MPTNRRLVQLGLDSLATELGAAAGTIATYTDDLNCYLAWLRMNSLGLEDIGLEQVRDYIAAQSPSLLVQNLRRNRIMPIWQSSVQ
jgi:integrase/recombinase XerD